MIKFWISQQCRVLNKNRRQYRFLLDARVVLKFFDVIFQYGDVEKFSVNLAIQYRMTKLHQPSTTHSFVNHVRGRVWDYHLHVLLRVWPACRGLIKLQSVQMIEPCAPSSQSRSSKASLNGRQPPPSPCDEWNVVGSRKKMRRLKYAKRETGPRVAEGPRCTAR